MSNMGDWANRSQASAQWAMVRNQKLAMKMQQRQHEEQMIMMMPDITAEQRERLLYEMHSRHYEEDEAEAREKGIVAAIMIGLVCLGIVGSLIWMVFF